MYYPHFYTDLNKKKIGEDVKREGFDPIIFSNEPSFVYSPHEHPETKLLVFLEGSMEVRVGEKTYHCKRGDKLIIPGNTKHSAIVGPEGCIFFWSEKII